MSHTYYLDKHVYESNIDSRCKFNVSQNAMASVGIGLFTLTNTEVKNQYFSQISSIPSLIRSLPVSLPAILSVAMLAAVLIASVPTMVAPFLRTGAAYFLTRGTSNLKNDRDQLPKPFLGSQLTMPSVCHEVYRRQFMPENSIALIPAFGYQNQEATSFKAILWLKNLSLSKNIII